MIICGIAFLIFSFLPLKVPYYIIVIPMILSGIGGGMFVAPNVASIMNSVPMNRRGIASGVSSTMFNTGSLLSLGVSFAIMAQSMPLNVLQAIFAGIPIQAGQVNASLFQQAMQRIFIFHGIHQLHSCRYLRGCVDLRKLQTKAREQYEIHRSEVRSSWSSHLP